MIPFILPNEPISDNNKKIVDNTETIDLFLSHSFNVSVAKKCGLHAAIVFNHILYWINYNSKKPNVERHDGYVWMYETQKDMAKYFGYLLEDDIQKAIKKLVEKGYVIKKCLSKNKFDKTASYTIPLLHQKPVFSNNFCETANQRDHTIGSTQEPTDSRSEKPDFHSEDSKKVYDSANQRDRERYLAGSLYMQKEHKQKEQPCVCVDWGPQGEKPFVCVSVETAASPEANDTTKQGALLASGSPIQIEEPPSYRPAKNEAPKPNLAVSAEEEFPPLPFMTPPPETPPPKTTNYDEIELVVGRDKTIKMTKEKLYEMSVLQKFDWTADEIENLWPILKSYEGIINSVPKFCDGTIKNMRKINKINALKQVNEKEQKWKNKTSTNNHNSSKTKPLDNEMNDSKPTSNNTNCTTLDPVIIRQRLLALEKNPNTKF